MYKGLVSAEPANLPVAKKMAERVICLPIYPELSIDIVQSIINIIRK